MWEYSINFGSLTSGDHYLQILREDHGAADGYHISVAGDVATRVPEPSTMLLFGSSIISLLAGRRMLKR
jgi:hypothetical protein